jgi:serine/threonine protein kinase
VVLHRLGSHDRIPRLLAHFEEEHEFYLVQELIDGCDLTSELIPSDRSVDGYPVGRMNEAQAIAFLRDILEILAYVHQQGAIHRDIKPANLMRRRSDGKLVLIDFGAVKQVATTIANSNSNSTSKSNLTVAIGTDGYMPNEQAIGKPRPCSDLYAVGMIAIQGLTGVPPSLLAEDMETGEIAWRQSPMRANPKYRTDVSDDLARVIDKLVRYDFRDRYQSAEDAIADLAKLNAPTVVNTNAQDLTIVTNAEGTNRAVTNGELTNINEEIAPTLVSQNFQLKRQNWLAMGAVGMVSAIAVIGAVMFLRPTTALKNDLNIGASSPSAKYVFLSERAIVDSDLSGKSDLELDVMRNEVFARYGRRFKIPELQSYFNKQPWYQPRYEPDQFPEDLLTPIESQNVQYIRDFQARAAQKGIASPAQTINPADAKCDYTKRLISDPNPPINVRTGAGKDFAIAGTLDNGTQVTVQGEKQGWLQISAPIAGWVAANRTKPICL